jgi:orotate phosphoribosyltransferase
MLNREEVRSVLESVGAIVTGSHFVYISGLHGRDYINKDALFMHPDTVSRLCETIAVRFVNDGIEVVIAPAGGAMILSQWVTHHLSRLTNREVLAVYADRDGDYFVIKRGYEKIIPGKLVLVVEDLLTTGLTVSKVVEAVRELHGIVCGVGGIANRGRVTLADLGHPPCLVSLLDVPMEMYPESDCPLCKQGVPINTTLGHGATFLAKNR